ncbi:lipase-like domain-containing protein, partial [Staphylococcus epidermidis]
DWKGGEKIDLVGDSMGGERIGELEEVLRDGNGEEVEYEKEDGGEICRL